MLEMISETIDAGARDYALGRPCVKFDDDWFAESCDFSDLNVKPFESSEFQVSENEAADAEKWQEGMKCENHGDGREPVIHDDVTSHKDCVDVCHAASVENKGTVVCCEFDQDRKQCEIRIGWQALEKSNYGTDMKNPLNWIGRKPKVARLLYTGIGEDDPEYVALDEHEEFLKAKEGQAHVRKLIEEVNHMSIDGILDHLLSFYICMRWVPDEDFVDLAKFESANMPVTAKTVLRTDPTRDDTVEDYIKFAQVPLRCGTGMHVQHVEEIDKLIATLEEPTSGLSTAYRFSEQVASASSSFFTKTFSSMKSIIEATDGELHYEYPKEGQKSKDSVYVQDMQAKVAEELPWSGILRAANEKGNHRSDANNLFMLCFGPRVASYPHKREGGEHFLADMNMAGCSGFWDLANIK